MPFQPPTKKIMSKTVYCPGCGKYPCQCPCPNCGYRTCTCNDPRAASPSTPAPPYQPTQDDIDEDNEDYLDHMFHRAMDGWGKDTIRDWMQVANAQIRELRKRLRLLEKGTPDPNHHIIKGPPRS